MFRKKPATYEDLRALAPNLVGEIIDGELFASPRPASPHAYTASALGTELHGAFHRGRGGPGGWWIVFEPEIHFGPDTVVPDIAGWRRERMPEYPNTAFFTLAPDWLAEISSPSTAGHDRVRKLPLYLRQGVGHVWLVEPLSQTLEVLRREGERWILAANATGSDSVRLEPFEAIEIDLSALWMPGNPGEL